MINIEEAHKLYDETVTKRGKEFDAQIKGAYKDVEDFVPVPIVDKYLDSLVKERIAEGIDTARFSTKDFLNKMKLNEKWEEKKKELTKKYPLIFGTNYSSGPDVFLNNEVRETCSEILARNQYISVNRYKHTFTWELVDQNRMPKCNFLDKILSRRKDSANFQEYLSESRYERDQEEKEQEETRKMTKFAKILAKELKDSSK